MDSIEKVRKHQESARNWGLKNPNKVRAYRRKYRSENPDKVRKSREKYKLENPDKVRQCYSKWSLANPDKIKAYRRLNDALRYGKIIRPDTCSCGASNPEGHHSDYSKPLMVSWLCRKCHKKIHKSGADNPDY